MSRRALPRQQLSERDERLLRDLARLRVASASQLIRLHFAEGTEIGRQRRGQAALRRLTQDGYLDRLPRRIGGPGSGSARFVYQLGYRGQRLVRPGSRARTPGDVSYPFVLHGVAVSEVVVQLVEAERAGRGRDLRVETESDVWRHFVDGSGRPVVLKPDLGVRLQVEGIERAWFVEVDRSTESLTAVGRKAGQYLRYWRSGREQAVLGAFPRVLWSVPDERRAAGLRRTFERLPAPAEAMFTVALAAATSDALLGVEARKEQPVTEGGIG